MPPIIENRPGVGIEYEIFVPAYYALKLNCDKNVQDFTIRTNVKLFGNMDDVLIETKMKDGREHKFAFQLKHKQNRDHKVVPSNFTANGDFNIVKYCQAFKQLNQDHKQYHVILYTNGKFDSNSKKKVKYFKMVEDDPCEEKRFFNTSNDSSRNIYKFEVNDRTRDNEYITRADYQLFFSKFTLYICQKNFEDFEDAIFDIFKNKEACLIYINFFRKWHQGKFTNNMLDKATVNIQLIDILLSSCMVPKPNWDISTDQAGNLEVFKEAVRKFDVTVFDGLETNVIEELVKSEPLKYFEEPFPDGITERLERYSKQYTIDLQKLTRDEAMAECMVQLGKEYKFIDKSKTELQLDEKIKIFNYFFGKFLIINFNEQSKNLIYAATDLYRTEDDRIQLLFLGEEINTAEFAHLKTFENLKDLQEIDCQLYEEAIERAQISLQGRDSISLKQLLTYCDDIGGSIRTSELYSMLKVNYWLGEEKEVLPGSYIPRRVSTVVLDIDEVLDHFICTKDLVIVNSDVRLIKDRVQQKGMELVEIDSFLKSNYQKSKDLIIMSTGFTKVDFDQVCQKNQNCNVHLVKILNESSFMLLMSTKNTFSEVKYKKFYLEEKKIHSHFDGPVNMVCAQPGMGKSIMLKYLRNVCPSEYWTLGINLKSYNSFLKGKPRSDEMLSEFLKVEDKQDKFFQKTLDTFLRRKKIYIFFDGLDEIEVDCIDHLLDCVKELSTTGYRVWISSRPNQQEKLESILNIFPVEIEGLSERQKVEYVKQRLTTETTKFTPDAVQQIITKIFNNNDVENNHQVLGVPLQLYMITQIFLDDKQHSEIVEKNMFILTKIYKTFFKGKFEHFSKKLSCENQQLFLFTLDQYLTFYEIPALQACLSEEILKKLNIDLTTSNMFLDSVRESGDRLGIIIKVNSEGTGVFEHLSFAEYFTCVYLAKNFDKIRTLRDELFSQRYQNLFLILNIILAENCPLHLATIYKNLPEINRLLSDDGNCLSSLDKGGRNPLHIASCTTTRHQPLKCSACPSRIDDSDLHHFKGETLKNQEVVKAIAHFDPLQEDKLFQWNSLKYSFAFGSLFSVEAIVEKHEKVNSIFENYHEAIALFGAFSDATIAYYSARFGYPHLLSVILDTHRTSHIIKMTNDAGDSLLHLVVKRNGDVKIIDLLLKHHIDVDAKNKSGKTSLSIAAEKSRVDAFNLLVDNNANINPTDNYKNTVLYYAAVYAHNKIFKFMLTMGVDVNTKNESGRTVLAVAAERGRRDIVKEFLAKNGDVYATDDNDNTALHYVAKNGNLEISGLLLNNGVDVNAKNKNGKTALHIAAQMGTVQTIDFFIENQASVNATDVHGNTALHYAAKNGYLGIIDLLLKKNVDVNAQNTDGATALHYAVYSRKVKAVQLLLDGGLTLDLIDINNIEYPLYFAVKDNNLQADLLLKMTEIIHQYSPENIVRYFEEYPLYQR